MIDTSFIENLTKDLEKKVKGIQDAGSKRNIISIDGHCIDMDCVAMASTAEQIIVLKSGQSLQFNNPFFGNLVKKVSEELERA